MSGESATYLKLSQKAGNARTKRTRRLRQGGVRGLEAVVRDGGVGDPPHSLARRVEHRLSAIRFGREAQNVRRVTDPSVPHLPSRSELGEAALRVLQAKPARSLVSGQHRSSAATPRPVSSCSRNNAARAPSRGCGYTGGGGTPSGAACTFLLQRISDGLKPTHKKVERGGGTAPSRLTSSQPDAARGNRRCHEGLRANGGPIRRSRPTCPTCNRRSPRRRDRGWCRR